MLNFSVKETGESDFFGFLFRRNQGYFWLIWAFVLISVVAAKNLVRTRQGRAMQSVRDRDLSAEVIGVNLARTKTMAFAVSGALAALSGALYGSYLQSVTPEFFNLGLSIQYVAMIIVGGVGTVFGSVVGAISVGSIERLIDRFRWLFQWIPFLNLSPSGRGITLQNFVRMVFGGFIISFLMFFPLGIAGLWHRIKRYFQTWPFS